MKLVSAILSKIGVYAVIIFVIAVSVFPVLWVFFSSIKTNFEILSGPFVLPSSFNLAAYEYLFYRFNFLRFFNNSLFVSVASTVIALVIYTMAAYVIARFNFYGKYIFYGLFTMTLLVPHHARTQPIFSLIFRLGLYDTLTALVLVYVSIGMAVSIFILKNAFMSVPVEISESATVDGAGFFRVFWSINLPLARNGIVTAGILMFLANWNEFFYALLLTASPLNRTLPVLTTLFTTQFSYDYAKTFAALTLLIVPGILIYAFAQEQVQNSIASGAVKG